MKWGFFKIGIKSTFCRNIWGAISYLSTTNDAKHRGSIVLKIAMSSLKRGIETWSLKVLSECYLIFSVSQGTFLVNMQGKRENTQQQKPKTSKNCHKKKWLETADWIIINDTKILKYNCRKNEAYQNNVIIVIISLWFRFLCFFFLINFHFHKDYCFLFNHLNYYSYQWMFSINLTNVLL